MILHLFEILVACLPVSVGLGQFHDRAACLYLQQIPHNDSKRTRTAEAGDRYPLALRGTGSWCTGDAECRHGTPAIRLRSSLAKPSVAEPLLVCRRFLDWFAGRGQPDKVLCRQPSSYNSRQDNRSRGTLKRKSSRVGLPRPAKVRGRVALPRAYSPRIRAHPEGCAPSPDRACRAWSSPRSRAEKLLPGTSRRSPSAGTARTRPAC